MESEEFEKLVREGIAAIPKEFLDKIVNVAIVVENNPTPQQLKKLNIKNSYVLFGLYEGIPRTRRWEYGQVAPDKITIFKNPIISLAKSDEEIKRIVKDTVWHEIGHYFGMNEEQVRMAEKRHKSKKEDGMII
ncbi:MAG: metallopeptidase family protein [Candidatus Paceibacterota bacterium]|jgi:predicted Zn-dependent protease with MMP-like domain|nr:metallopeptidase family protein [bacterium]